MSDTKEPKKPVLIRLPLPVLNWLFSEALRLTEHQRTQVSVPALIVMKITDAQGDEPQLGAIVEQGEIMTEKKSVLVRLPMSAYEGLFSESVEIAKARRVRTSVPSLVVEKLTRMYFQEVEHNGTTA
ncbi:hypothetical protein FX016_23145 [Cupriavidus gilardii]|nr:hypothetical protein FX016_23145 [Cupriavidus gilardii]